MDSLKSGMLPVKILNKDWLAGSSPLEHKIINPDGDWTQWLPSVEYQNRWSYDRMACITYANLNAIETLYRFQTGRTRNFSDRFLAKMSNTSRQGNTVSNVFDTARKVGLVDEDRWPDVAGGWDEYYKPIPQEIINEGQDFLKDWLLYREWITTNEDMFFALKLSPLVVTLKYASGNGILNPAGIADHGVMVFNAKRDEYWEIFDHYTQSIKKYAWDYNFDSCLKPSLIRRTNIKLMIQESTLVFLTQKGGEFGLYINGCIIVDRVELLLAQFMTRNNGYIQGKTISVTLEDWEKYPKYTFKEYAELNK